MFFSRISHTAWIVMRCQLAGRWAGAIAPDYRAFYQACFDYCPKVSWYFRALPYWLPEGAQLTLIERILAFGAPLHFVLRKKALGEKTLEALGQGALQVVNIGAGFDAMAVLMARAHPGVQFFEIDTPAMHFHKMNIVRAHLGEVPGNFHGIGADLSRQSLQDTLRAHAAYDVRKPTVFVAEGVMMYLSENSVVKLLSDLRALSAGKTWFLFTAIERLAPKKPGFWKTLLKPILGAVSEHFTWSARLEEMPGYLRKQGFLVDKTLSYADLQKPWRTPAEMAKLLEQNGEFLVLSQAE